MSVAPWQEEVAKTREMAKQYRKVLDETFGTRVEEIEDIEVCNVQSQNHFLFGHLIYSIQ